MTEAVKSVPEGYHTVTPYFTVADAGGFLDFLKQVFDAEETERMAGPDGRVRHAEARIGNSKVMIGQATEQWRGKPNAVYVYVADVDATYHKALGAGARTISEPTTHFYGDRSGGDRGLRWQHVVDRQQGGKRDIRGGAAPVREPGQGLRA